MEDHFHQKSHKNVYDLPFAKRNLLQWETVQRQLFPLAIPNHATWDDFGQIIDVLNAVGKIRDVNHMHLPWGGGYDLSGAKSSTHEPGCLELITPGSMCLVKPERLRFESFDDDLMWNYFWLDTKSMPPSGAGSVRRMHEEVTDIGGELYADWSCWDDDLYDGEPLPGDSRRVVRCLGGSFLILQKTSPYNLNTHTYDGRHHKIGPDAFRKFYETLLAASRQNDKQPSFRKPAPTV